MRRDRRDFLKGAGCLAAAGLGFSTDRASAGVRPSADDPWGDEVGVLVDLPNCIGCRLCERACDKEAGFAVGPVEAYEDKSVFAEPRRPSPNAFTVVNAYPDSNEPSQPVYVKSNCLHCRKPACASACLVGAIRRQADGSVSYDASKCMGCRYCMVACPFQIPTFEYDDPLTPEIRKCTFCFQKRAEQGGVPACVKICPREIMTFGRRSDMLELARAKIRAHPDLYVDHIYGEHEAGGTAWLYLSRVRFEDLGFVPLDAEAPPGLTEAIQHGLFKHAIPPMALTGLLGMIMWLSGARPGEPGTEGADASLPAKADPPPAEGGGEIRGPPPPQSSDAGSRPGDAPEAAWPVRRTLRTPGVFVLLALAALGASCAAYRFIFGLEAATNLDQQYPWGLWIGIDVATGVALAAGGFTTAALVHIFGRHRYHALVRPALLTALLGYTFVGLGLLVDLGRYYNIWHPVWPTMWQGNSVLFEVAICVVCYLTVLYIEFLPIVCERFIGDERFPRLGAICAAVKRLVARTMFAFIIAGVVLSCLHQSSLGNLMVIAPSKVHPLWYTPILSLLFLLSALAVGFPMVVFESMYASWSLKLKPEMHVLSSLAKYIPVFLGVYLAFKVGDMVIRESYVHLAEGSTQSRMFILELVVGVIAPLIMLLSQRVRNSPRGLFAAASLIVLGVGLNRVNVFLIGYQPPYAAGSYFPSAAEFAVTIGLIAALMLLYRLVVTFLGVLGHPGRAGVA